MREIANLGNLKRFNQIFSLDCDRELLFIVHTESVSSFIQQAYLCIQANSL